MFRVDISFLTGLIQSKYPFTFDAQIGLVAELVQHALALSLRLTWRELFGIKILSQNPHVCIQIKSDLDSLEIVYIRPGQMQIVE